MRCYSLRSTSILHFWMYFNLLSLEKRPAHQQWGHALWAHSALSPIGLWVIDTARVLSKNLSWGGEIYNNNSCPAMSISPLFLFNSRIPILAGHLTSPKDTPPNIPCSWMHMSSSARAATSEWCLEGSCALLPPFFSISQAGMWC